MHIPDGMLDTKTLAATWVAAVPAVGWGVRQVRRRASDGRLVLMSVLAAVVFALQMLNFPVAGGTSGHFAGGALAAILLGPWPAVLVISAVLMVQALLFADGGITALAANVWNLAIVAPFVGWWVYSLALRIRDSRGARVVGAFAAAWAGCVSAALSAGAMLWISGAAPFAPVMGAMGLWHALIGIGEGLVTAGLVAYVFTLRPELMHSDAEVLRPRALAVSLGVLALAGAGLSFLASNRPDALEHVAAKLSFPHEVDPVWRLSPMAGYVVPGIADDTLAGILAGMVGVVLAGVMLYGGLQSLKRRRSDAR